MFIAQHIVISVKSKSFVFYGHTTSVYRSIPGRVVRKNVPKREKDIVFRD